jgi:L-alanine-DL-glutamate epimerase-like enolase superfamily enzyme
MRVAAAITNGTLASVRMYSLVRDLPLEVEDYALEALERPVSSDFIRRTTVVRLRGNGQEGVGEDVTYDGEAQAAFQDAGAAHALAGRYSLSSFSERVGSLDLFAAGAPRVPEWRSYRRWAFESAALDLALRQAGRSLAEALGRRAQPVRFVVSMRLGEPPTTDPIHRFLDLDPTTRFKLDPTSSWDEPFTASLAALDAVDVVDLKAAYRGTVVDQAPDPRLYRLVAEAFPAAWIEDPGLDHPEAAAALAPHLDRVTWDAVIHSTSDVEQLPREPRALNSKPSRFGSVQALFDFYDLCAERGIELYGGGQFELGPGRGQIQYLASLFHPDASNDVAPSGYNDPAPSGGLPGSPLEPAAEPIGFRWLSP